MGAMRNWITRIGLTLAAVAFVALAVCLVADLFMGHGHPMFGLLTYMLIPVALVGCILLAVLGVILKAWRLRRKGVAPLHPSIDFTDRRSLRRLASGIVIFAAVFAVSSVAAYRAFHYVESVEFCGLVCHNVMEPEHTTFLDSPHAHTSCVECHVGPGVSALVRSKIDGLYEVYALAFNKYHRPIDPPVKNLRPARETCESCHWPEKFFGAVLRNWTYYLSDEENSPWTIKMLLKIGGGDPRHGSVQGFHWHMEGVNDVEYITTDTHKLGIPWVRRVDQDGKVTVFQTTDEDKRLTAEQIASLPKRTMDCMDCHNRPTHGFLSPNEAVDLSMSAGRLDTSMPELKYTAAELLGDNYDTKDEALAAIEDRLRETYEDHAGADAAVKEVQAIYSRNMFPEMKVRWDAYPDHSGHKTTPGCFRCHDGQHVSESGETIRRDCGVCHIIIAQGPGTDPDGYAPSGLEFQHPEDIDGAWKEMRCDECHTGSP